MQVIIGVDSTDMDFFNWNILCFVGLHNADGKFPAESVENLEQELYIP